jgi:hypothetical protein
VAGSKVHLKIGGEEIGIKDHGTVRASQNQFHNSAEKKNNPKKSQNTKTSVTSFQTLLLFPQSPSQAPRRR